MRMLTRFCALPMLVAVPVHASPGAHSTPVSTTSSQLVADTIPVSVRWNRLVPSVASADAASRRAARTAAASDAAALRRLRQSQPPLLMRVYTMLSVAQYATVNSVRDARAVSTHVAVATASASVLAGLYADSAARALIARELSRDVELARTAAGGAGSQALAGKTLGEEIARRVLSEAPALEIMAPWDGSIPKGPGMWYTAPGVPPIGIRFATARPWLLDSPAQFRPAAPAAFGSSTWLKAMEDVRQVAKARTAEQTALAQKWNSTDPWAHWNELASAAIRHRRMSEADAARVLAVMNAGATDAIIACFEAKYHYWTIRPSQADTTLGLAADVDVPNFPSFPSGHACSAGAFDAALGHFFSAERASFTMVAEEQAMSRLYGGVHYRFDNDVGLALGRAVARNAVQRERRGGLNAWRADGAAGRP